MKKAIFAALAVLAMAGSAAAEAVDWSKVSTCDKWTSGKLVDKLDSGFTDKSGIAYYQATFAGKAAKVLTAKYGPMEGSFSSNALGVGVKTGFSYESIVNTFYEAAEQMTEDDAKRLIVVMASNIYMWNSDDISFDSKVNRAMVFVIDGVQPGLNVFRFLGYDHRLSRDNIPRTEQYKKLWLALFQSDSQAFLRTVREDKDGFKAKWVGRFDTCY